MYPCVAVRHGLQTDLKPTATVRSSSDLDKIKSPLPSPFLLLSLSLQSRRIRHPRPLYPTIRQAHTPHTPGIPADRHARGADLRCRHDRFNRESVVALWRVPDRHFGDTDGRVLAQCYARGRRAWRNRHFGLQRRVAVQPIVMGAFVRLFGGRHALSWSSPPTTSVRDAWSR